MSRYTYTVHQHPLAAYPPYVERQGVFSSAECAQIVTLGMAQEALQATIGEARQTVPDVRRATVRWLPFAEGERWLWERLTTVCEEVNAQVYGFDLVGFIDALQLTEYSTGAHYTWHTDLGPGAMSLRKLSLSVQLSCWQTYKGGDLEMHLGTRHEPTTRVQGDVVVFPSFQLHRVCAVSSGTRQALVAWCCGHRPWR